MKIQCHYCDSVYDMDKDDWSAHRMHHMAKCEWFRKKEMDE